MSTDLEFSNFKKKDVIRENIDFVQLFMEIFYFYFVVKDQLQLKQEIDDNYSNLNF